MALRYRRYSSTGAAEVRSPLSKVHPRSIILARNVDCHEFFAIAARVHAHRLTADLAVFNVLLVRDRQID